MAISTVNRLTKIIEVALLLLLCNLTAGYTAQVHCHSNATRLQAQRHSTFSVTIMDDDEDILRVNLTRNEHFGYGFSLLGVSGLPHVIYDIVENSPAECEEVRGRESRLHLAKNHPGCYFDLWPVPWQFMIELNVYLR